MYPDLLKRTVCFLLAIRFPLLPGLAACHAGAGEASPVTAAEKAPGETDTSLLLDRLTDLAFLSGRVGTLVLPEDTSVYSPALAEQLLLLCNRQKKEEIADMFSSAAFSVLCEGNYEEETGAFPHTCAYTLGQGKVTVGGKPRDAFLIAVRGTTGDEWYSNFDFSDDPASPYATNFLRAAEDILSHTAPFIEKEREPLILLTGYSRGAACANLLALLFNRRYSEKQVIAYTYATPATLLSTAPGANAYNIFNHINTADVVPKLPLAAWGYRRAGRDIFLPADENLSEETDRAMAMLLTLAPNQTAYYRTRYSLSGKGEDPNGMTTYEICLLLGKAMAGGGAMKIGAALPAVDRESPFFPFLSLLTSLTSRRVGKGLWVFSQHAPLVYYVLLSAVPMTEE